MDNAGQTWVAFVREYMDDKPAPAFVRPKGVVTSGSEIYIKGTQPGGPRQVDVLVPTVTPPPESSSSTDTGSDDTRRQGSGDGRAPAPTCRPGSLTAPPGCVVPGPG
jgi:hypothetical protein